MKIAILSVTEKGRILSRKIGALFRGEHTVKRYCFHKYSDEHSERFSDIYAVTKKLFGENGALIFVCSCGIAVRAIAPLVRAKNVDPAVLVIDDCGKYAIPVLSGHLGGANRLAEIAAERLGAIPVITTATDGSGAFSPDLFASANQLLLSDLKAAKEIAAAVLNGEKIGLKSDYPFQNPPPEISEDTVCRTGIRVGETVSEKPFEITLNLVPKNIVLGIGCKKNTAFGEIKNQVEKAFSGAGLDLARIRAAATIDIKSEEKGLLEFCENAGITLYTYSAEELMSLTGKFNSSDFVRSRTGADNVCERSAVKCSGGRIVLPKFVGNGVTVAAAEIPVTLDFERKIF